MTVDLQLKGLNVAVLFYVLLIVVLSLFFVINDDVIKRVNNKDPTIYISSVYVDV